LFWILAIACILLILFTVGLLYAYRTCFYASPNPKEDPYCVLIGRQYLEVKERIYASTRRMDDAPCQWVETTSFDGLKLRGRYYHTQDNAPILLLFHGYRSMTLRDSAGGYYLGKLLGFNILAVDQRCHGNSQGHTIGFGILERRDCLSWINFILDNYGKDSKIILSGLSMGAATVLLASELDLPKNVLCIMADCPYSSADEIIRKVSRDRGIPDDLAYPFINLSARLFGRFHLTASSAKDAVKHAKIPILLFHGEDDRFVPCEMSRKIYANCNSRAELHTFPGAGHGLCYIVDPVGYEKTTIAFLETIPELEAFLKESINTSR